MLRLAMPHAGFNPDNAIAYPEVIRPTQAVPKSPAYDWMIEMLGQDLSKAWVADKIGERGWRLKAFENYRDYILSKYNTLDARAVYTKWFSEDNGKLPVWDRTSSSATEPIGWFDVETQSFRRGKQEDLLHEDKPDATSEVSLVSAWIRRECRFG